MTADGNDDPENDPLLKSMRSVWLGMRDEEPPARGLAELMAAARAQADVMKPKEAWWRRAFALLARPPVLAAATVIVVVGGAIALNRGGDRVAAPEPRAQSVETTPPASPPPGTQSGKDAKLEFAPSAGSAAAPAGRDDTSPNVATPTTRPQGPRPSPVIKQKVDAVKEATIPPPPPPPPPAGAGEGLVIAGEPPKIEQTKTVEKKPVDAPTSRPQPEPAKVADEEADFGSAPTVDRAPTPRRNAAPAATTDQLVKQAQAAASRNDCPAVRVTAERVKKTDPTAYKTRLITQPTIARCLK